MHAPHDTNRTLSRVVSILQPGYLPYPGFFELMARCDVFVIYDDVQYDKHSWRNRNRIRNAAGPIWLTVPVRTKGFFGQSIRDIRIDNATPWARKHLHTIAQCYAQAPYAAEHMPFFKDLYTHPWEQLIDLNERIIAHFRALLGIKTTIVRSSSLSPEGAKTERILSICRELQADAYISTNGAKPYLEASRFEEQGIALAWQDYQPPVYDQGHKDFIPGLSCVDVLMHRGPASRDTILMTSGCPFNTAGAYRGIVQ